MSLFSKVKMSPSEDEKMEIMNMSTKELSRLEVMQKVADKRISQKEAGVILNFDSEFRSEADQAIVEKVQETGRGGFGLKASRTERE